MAKRDIIAIGGSAGSTAVLRRLMADMPADFAGSLFITTHVPSGSPGYLADSLNALSVLPVTQAIDGQPIESGHVYVAAPDEHLLVIDGTIRLGDGPRENLTRPAIDPLFRSAALSYGPRVVGVVLSGMLNDGAAGLHAIKACGGTAIVQHPLDAESDEMPLAALEAVNPDEIVSTETIAEALVRMAGSDAGPSLDPPASLELEVAIAGGARLGSHALANIADPSPLSCPDCHGVLSEVRGETPLRYRCQIGHAFTAETLASRTEEVGRAMRVALRVMEERVTLVTRMAEDARQAGRSAVAELYEARSREYARYAEILREAAVRSLRLDRDRRGQNL